MSNASYLKIQNYGPIIDTGKLRFDRLTIFVGEQGSGKSTIAKTFSTMSWIEKTLVRQKISKKIFSIHDFISAIDKQQIPKDYITNDTIIEYKGIAYNISISKNKISFKLNDFNNYICPKIQYFPSERNVLSVYDGAISLNYPLYMLDLLNYEIKNANNNKKLNKIEFNDFDIKYDKNKLINNVIKKKTNLSLPLSKASSGMQSVFPLLKVSKHLVNENKLPFEEKILNVSNDIKEICYDEINKSSIIEKLKTYFNSGYNKSFSSNEIEKLREQLKKYINSCIIEIVEEPEQNLFPTSQLEILNNIICDTSATSDKLVLTTHSPYILSAINNFIYAHEKLNKIKKDFSFISRLSYLPYDEVTAYKINNGIIKSILDDELKCIDVSEIDLCSDDINKLYDKISMVKINE